MNGYDNSLLQNVSELIFKLRLLKEDEMLENYFGSTGVAKEKRQRLLAVQAALEIAKASVSAPSSNTYSSRVRDDITNIAEGVEKLADAIQRALQAEEQ